MAAPRLLVFSLQAVSGGHFRNHRESRVEKTKKALKSIGISGPWKFWVS
jgi:hypothetical protein